jgi:hypothetical protein
MMPRAKAPATMTIPATKMSSLPIQRAPKSSSLHPLATTTRHLWPPAAAIPADLARVALTRRPPARPDQLIAQMAAVRRETAMRPVVAIHLVRRAAMHLAAVAPIRPGHIGVTRLELAAAVHLSRAAKALHEVALAILLRPAAAMRLADAAAALELIAATRREHILVMLVEAAAARLHGAVAEIYLNRGAVGRRAVAVAMRPGHGLAALLERQLRHERPTSPRTSHP